MSFEPIGKSATANRVAVACMRQGGGPGYYSPRLLFGEEAMEKTGWKNGDHVALALGTDDDKGWMRISQNSLGNKISKDGSGRGSYISVAGRLGDNQKHPTAPVEHRINDGHLDIKMPEWMGLD